MGELDKVRDSINNTRMYMGICVTFIIAVGAGTASLYRAGEVTSLFWIGIALVVGFSLMFVALAKSLHKKTDRLKDL